MQIPNLKDQLDFARKSTFRGTLVDSNGVTKLRFERVPTDVDTIAAIFYTGGKPDGFSHLDGNEYTESENARGQYQASTNVSSILDEVLSEASSFEHSPRKAFILVNQKSPDHSEHGLALRIRKIELVNGKLNLEMGKAPNKEYGRICDAINFDYLWSH